MGGVIEEDGTVEFTETGAKPDSLEQTVAGAAGSADATGAASGAITCGDKVWEAYKSLCGTFQSSSRPPQEDCYKDVIVNMLQMSYLNRGSAGWAAVFRLGQLLPEHFLTCLKNIYGDTFDGSDIEDKIRTGTHEGKVPDEIAALFPELVSLSQLPSSGYILGDLDSHTEGTLTLTSPYLLVLCASPQYKPVIAGGIELAINNQAFPGINFALGVDIITTTHGKEKLTKYVAQYAKQIGQHKNLIPILQELNRIPIKERR